MDKMEGSAAQVIRDRLHLPGAPRCLIFRSKTDGGLGYVPLQTQMDLEALSSYILSYNSEECVRTRDTTREVFKTTGRYHYHYPELWPSCGEQWLPPRHLYKTWFDVPKLFQIARLYDLRFARTDNKDMPWVGDPQVPQELLHLGKSEIQLAELPFSRAYIPELLQSECSAIWLASDGSKFPDPDRAGWGYTIYLEDKFGTLHHYKSDSGRVAGRQTAYRGELVSAILGVSVISDLLTRWPGWTGVVRHIYDASALKSKLEHPERIRERQRTAQREGGLAMCLRECVSTLKSSGAIYSPQWQKSHVQGASTAVILNDIADSLAKLGANAYGGGFHGYRVEFGPTDLVLLDA
jgi:hypothetical protein